MSEEDIRALQLVRTAAAVALRQGVIHIAVERRVADAIARVTALVAFAAEAAAHD